MDRINFLFDLDETLLNFHASEKIGLKEVVEACGCVFNDEVYAFFKARNKELWLMLERGEITRQELFDTRFRELLARCGADTSETDFLKVNSEFISAMARNGVILDGALELLERIKTGIKGARVYIVSNGATVNALGRIKSTGMDAYIDGTFISEDMGVNKPSPEFFRIVLDSIGARKENCIVIGDSLSSDMLGAKNAGITSCWFKPAGDVDAAVREYGISYTAGTFEELYEVLVNWATCNLPVN